MRELPFFKNLLSNHDFIIDTNHGYYSNRVVQFFLQIARNAYFDAFIMLTIIVNTICLSIDGSPPLITNKEVLEFLYYSNFVFAFIFLLEVVIKVIGMVISITVGTFNRTMFMTLKSSAS